MNRLNQIDIDIFKKQYEETSIRFFFIINNQYYNDYLEFFNSYPKKELFEDFSSETKEISPVLIYIDNFKDFSLVFERLRESNSLNFVASKYDFGVVFDEMKKLLEIDISNLGRYLFRFYDNYVLDFTNSVINEARRQYLIGRFFDAWYWNDLEEKIVCLKKNTEGYTGIRHLKINQKEYEKINELIYPFSLRPKFEDYKEFGGLKYDLLSDRDWYEEINYRLNRAKERGLVYFEDIKLYSLLSFGLGDDIFDKHPFNIALSDVLSKRTTLESALNEIKLSSLRS